MSAASDIYDIEGAFENAIKAVFTAAEVEALTSQDTLPFQKNRPRVEITMQLGQGKQRWKIFNGKPRETCWEAAVHLALVTDARMDVHASFRVQCRAIIAGIGDSINGTYLTHHHLQPCWIDGGTSEVFQPQDGYYLSNMIFNINVSVQNDAWDALAAA